MIEYLSYFQNKGQSDLHWAAQDIAEEFFEPSLIIFLPHIYF